MKTGIYMVYTWALETILLPPPIRELIIKPSVHIGNILFEQALVYTYDSYLYLPQILIILHFNVQKLTIIKWF